MGDEEEGVYRAQPYLYPCVLQYGVLAAAAMATLHANLHLPNPANKAKGTTTRETSPAYPSSMLHINFYRSHRGLFIGLVVFAGMSISVILSFSYFTDTTDNTKQPLFIFLITDLTLQAILIFACTINWFQIRNLSFAAWRTIHPDCVALCVAYILSFLFLLLRVIPLLSAVTSGLITTETILATCAALLALMVGVLQTCFIVDAFHREATNRWLKKKLPGRGTSMFLLIVNLAVWVLRTVYVGEVSDSHSTIHMYTYGQVVWSVLVQALWPWLLLYHFQAAVCFTYIWTTVYRPETVARLSRRTSHMTTLSPTVETADMGTQVKVVELKQRIKSAKDPTGELMQQTILSPVSEV